MSTTYRTFSEVCTKFYDLIVDSASVASFILDKIEAKPSGSVFLNTEDTGV